ncbi:MAG: LURP-one-related family protein [Firmicutes bacterium]|nr:LURP-one-related family protein [Bacillota bacterium]
MELYIKKAKLTVLDKYEVTDNKGNKVFEIRGELVSIGKRLKVLNALGDEIATIAEKKLSIRDVYVIRSGSEEVDVFRIDTLRKVPEYRAKELGWTLKGDFAKKSLKIMEGLHTVAEIRPKALSFGETLKLNVRKETEALSAVALYLVSELDQPKKPENATEK